MQNNRKKIIFLDGNYSGGRDNDVVPGQESRTVSEQKAVRSEETAVPRPAAVPVAGQTEQGAQEQTETDGEESEGAPTDAAAGPGAGQTEQGAQEQTETDGEGEGDEPLQQDAGGDYDYDLLSEGGRSSIDSASVVSSVGTNELLSVDPLYIRLTKFLETSNKMEGGSTANIADLLYDVSSSLKSIKTSFQEINSTLQKLAVTKASQ